MVDATAQRHIEGLGYAAGGVDDDSPFDQSKEDPKDLIAFHVANQHVLELIGDKKLAEAEQVCREQLAQRPDFVVGHMQLARIAALAGTGQMGEAMKHYRHALRIDPDHADAHNGLGVGLAKQGLSELARWRGTGGRGSRRALKYRLARRLGGSLALQRPPDPSIPNRCQFHLKNRLVLGLPDD